MYKTSSQQINLHLQDFETWAESKIPLYPKASKNKIKSDDSWQQLEKRFEDEDIMYVY